jgi:hypothetical protein
VTETQLSDYLTSDDHNAQAAAAGFAWLRRTRCQG